VEPPFVVIFTLAAPAGAACVIHVNDVECDTVTLHAAPRMSTDAPER
jgi:hypothetical protein